MKSKLERIRIDGLHGHKNIDVRFSNDTLILVGENGSGKTTFLRILFYFLSGRWLSLAQFRFEYIVVTISGVDYKLNREDVARRNDLTGSFTDVPPSVRRQMEYLIDIGEPERAMAELQRFSPYSSRYAREIYASQNELFTGISNKTKKRLQDLHAKVRGAINAQILYLPTYRRIERELGSILEGVDKSDIKKSLERNKRAETSETYIELVEFGMKDVQEAIDRSLASLKEFARESLNSLTLRYLGDVVNREYSKTDLREISDASEETIRAVLDRIHDSILNKADREHVFNVITSARSVETPTEHEKIIYHYFTKLLIFQQALQERERNISAFCSLCSEYIVDKEFVYDSANFSFGIRPTGVNPSSEIKLSDLSSGEKQIVSLFSHLYLSGVKRYFVLIDEPELSLSVPWQRRFLKDVRNGEYCAGLVAVTHSPFIYENELKPYAHSLGEFISS